MAQADGHILIDSKLDDSGLKAGFAKLGDVGKSALKGATAAVASLSAGLIAAGGYALRVGSQFESSLAKTSTLFGGVQVDTDNLKQKIVELSGETGLAASQIGESLYNALSAGIPVTEDMGDALNYMEKNAKLAKAGFTDIDTTVTATAKVLNAYKMDVAETDKVHKILIQTQNKGITTVGELGAVLAQVTPTAAAMNVEFEQVGAALATMTAQGTPTAQATTQLNSLFAELGKQGTAAQTALEKAAEGSEYAGMSFQDMAAKGVPLSEILKLMDDYAQASGKSLLDLFGSLEAGKAALSLSGENIRQFTDNLAAMSTEADIVGDAYDKVTDTFEHKSKLAKEAVNNLGITFYESFQEAAVGSLDALAKALSKDSLKSSVARLGDSASKLIDQFSSLAEKAIPVLIKGLTFLADNIKEIIAVAGSAYLAFKSFSILRTVAQIVQSTTAAWKTATAAVLAHEAANRLTLVTSLGATTAMETAVSLLTGKITLATAAQWAWNAAMTANPIGIVVAAVAALAIGIGVYIAVTEDATDATQELLDKNEEAIERSKALNETISESANQRKNDWQQMEAQASVAQDLSRELQNLADKTQKTVADKQRMAVIIDQLNQLIPDLGLAIIDESGALNKNNSEIDRAVTANLKLMKAKAAQEKLSKIAAEMLDVETDLHKKEEQIADTRKELDGITDQINQKQAQYGENTRLAATASADLYEQQNRVKESLAGLETQMQTSQQALNGLNEDYQFFTGYVSENTAVDEAAASIDSAAGSMGNLAEQSITASTAFGESTVSIRSEAELTDAELEQLQNRFEEYAQTASDAFSKVEEDSAHTVAEMIGNLEENQRAINEWADNLQLAAERGVDQGLLQTLRDAGPEMAGTLRNIVAASDEEISRLNDVFRNGAAVAVDAFQGEVNSTALSPSAKDAVAGVEGEFNQLPPSAEQTATETADAMKDTLAKKTPELVKQADTLQVDIVTAMKPMAEGFKGVGEDAVRGLWSGMSGLKGWIEAQVRSYARDLVQAAREAIDSHSPSKKTANEIGVPFVQGIGVGFEKAMPRVEGKLNAEMADLVARMQATVNLETARLSEQATAGTVYRASPAQTVTNDNGVSVSVYYQGTGNEQVDARRIGREIGRATEREMRGRGLVPV